MYNGAGIPTPRGSATSGHVSANKFKPNPRRSAAGGGPGGGAEAGERRPSADIVEHERKRRIEVQMLELEETLKAEGYGEDEIKAKIEEARKGIN